MRNVALFGGSFNPPHFAHVAMALYARSVAGMDEVVVVPVFQHPFAKELAPFEDRMAMCKIAMEWIAGVSVLDVERQLGGESRTLRTVEHLKAAHPNWSMRLLLGTDVLADVSKWYRYDRVCELAPPLYVQRIGYEQPGMKAVLPDISSTEVRAAIANHSSDLVEGVLPKAVLDYIQQRGLYK